MNVFAVAKAHNQKAVRQGWHQFCDPTLAFGNPSYTQLLSIWQAKAGDKAMPTRSEITPRDLKDVLRNIVMVERVAENPSQYNWRIIGTGITQILGHHTGKTFEESVPPQHLSRWIESIDLILDSQKPWRFFGRVHIHDREYLDAEHLYVPLANDNGVPSYVMGLCRYTPHRSEVEDAWENELASMPGGLL